MSTDITIETPIETERAAFVDYARSCPAGVGRSVAVAINDQTLTVDALTDALTAAAARWHDEQVSTDPDRFVFSHAINFVVAQRASSTEPVLDLPPLLGPACVVAYCELRWTFDEIASALDLSREAVARHVDIAHTSGLRPQLHRSPHFEVRQQVRELVAEQPMPQVNVNRIDRRTRLRSVRTMMKRAGLAIVLATAALVALAQLVARPERVASAPADTPAAEVTPLTATSTATPRGDASAAAGAIGNEPRPDLVPHPQVITTDGNGGFVGVRSPSPQNPQAVFTRSPDAQSWTLASRWNLGPGSSIDRFERSGEYFIVWIDGAAQTSETVIGTVGISRDLIAWTVAEIAVDVPESRGLTFKNEIASVSVSGSNILALVTTTVEVNYAALSLSEASTCGETLNQDQVIVKLCNDAELDVLSLSNVEALPNPTQLFLSRDGRPFDPIDTPFDNRTASHLTTVNGSFAVTDETGLRFATSTDALDWQTITAGKPPFPVKAATTNAAGEVVGFGDQNGQSVLFHHDGQRATTTAIQIEDLVGELDGDTDVVVGSSPKHWAVYLFEEEREEEGNAWLLTSPNGITWQATTTASPGNGVPRLLVGDTEAVLQWVDSQGEIVTFGITLPS